MPDGLCNNVIDVGGLGRISLASGGAGHEVQPHRPSAMST